MKVKSLLAVLLALGLFLLVGYICYARVIQNDRKELRDGDIIFQISRSAQSKAIQQATGSKYSHCGIIYNDGGKLYVFEAVQPVKRTLLDSWIARGENKHYVVKRLKNSRSILSKEGISRMKQIAAQFNGKSYDLTFEWSDEKMYCSELIWKIYKRALNVEVGKLQKLGDFDLSGNEVRKKLKECYDNNIPLNETVISPASIFNCSLLETVAEN